ncbi:MAG TPA: hypothetical protein VGR08_03670 [Thermomicrobiales bacterium]|nr:hypothetical protein [Thermomicrobiales bacterium]
MSSSTSLAQEDSTPQSAAPTSGATPTPVPDPGRKPTASGDPGESRQIGKAFDEVDTEKYRNLHRVDDPERILKLDQRIELADDAQRLTNHGLPTRVVIREGTASREESQATADQLRDEQNVESSEGVDDGMIMLVTVDPESSRSGMVVLSFGRNALPKGGLTAESVEEVYERTILPRLKRQRMYSALHVGIRRIIYLETYIPEAQPPLTESQKTARGAVNVLGPLAFLASAAGFVLSGRTSTRSRVSAGQRASDAAGVLAQTALLIGLGAVLLFVAAVVARSTIGVTSALLVGLLVWTQLLIRGLPRQSARPGMRTLTLPYRRVFRPARRPSARGADTRVGHASRRSAR